MDGFLIIDKPPGITSHDVVAKVRRILKTKRVGHTGTLDPFATGVMVILVGKATRLAQFLDKDEKEYEAVIKFGFETDTGDRTGTARTEGSIAHAETAARLDGINWETVFEKFRGETEQTPPMYSAKKIDGKKLYEHARKGETVEREARRITITKLELSTPEADDPTTRRIRVACSAGTYIRALAEDIGREIGIGAHLTELRRTRAGAFDLSQSRTLEELEQMQDPTSGLLPVELAVAHLPATTLAADRVEKTRGGLSTRVFETNFADGGHIQMLEESGRLIAVGIYSAEENAVKPKVVLV